MDTADLIRALSMEKHIEGGYFTETYRASEAAPSDRVGGERATMTSIFYMLTRDRPVGHFHRNASDIVHYFQAGSPIAYLLIDPEGVLHRKTLGLDFARGQVAQLVVPGGYWKASFLPDGAFGLLGEAVAPGFDYRDMTLATPALFQTSYPDLWPELALYVRGGAGSLNDNGRGW